ncbi:hypothetical protein P153DRAFT_280962 [Dothidotthia symphoricarpi CBS 119687]|uniref:C2 domain-containing protein n=1 Tax=Dothidotthia symphoricarpi CBS 119687 TaxID=1392245 RepID=A0A6A6ARJ1_9PLEO|nr:uncharacterized protein P153DRAFT_280962 [Dothidotthia symphoricarpi CBS 119687]KAF2133788.1 hypothetical protein P153DRAFT_280962 [Dothidotthia symphoricarpi CBS 119687]
MGSKVKTATFGGVHAAGIFSDMTVDGPVIGTLVAIVDRARNLPNKRTMGKQDPYCAARLGKEAKKTATDKRGGQTPKWDQELRFTVHDSPDYQRLKLSVFNDDKKTELIGETWVSLEAVIRPGGGQSDDWHGLNCKGKYAGEIRLEFTFYDSRAKTEKPPPERRREPPRTADDQSPAVGGPRESKPIKRRPLPTDPTGSLPPSPLNAPEYRGLQGVRAGPRELGSPRHHTPPKQPRNRQSETPLRRPVPVPDASPKNGTPVSSHTPPQRQPVPQDPYNAPPNPRSSNTSLHKLAVDNFDMSYAAPKPYEVQPVDAIPQHLRDTGHRRQSQDDFRSSRGHSQPHPPEPVHTHSAPIVPTQQTYEREARREQYGQHAHRLSNAHSPLYSDDLYQDPAYQVAPLRSSRSHDLRVQEQNPPPELYQSNSYMDVPSHYDERSSRRRQSAMQPTVEDEDYDLPPPPPMHRSKANQKPQPRKRDSLPPRNPDRYREEPPQPTYEPPQPAYEPPQPAYEPPQPPQPYSSNDHGHHQPTERRYTYPRPAIQASSQPESRDVMAPSPVRQDMPDIPASLVAGYDASRQERETPPPSYDAPLRLRQYSEPAEYRMAAIEYNTPSYSQQLVHHQSFPPNYPPDYYPHDPPEQPRRTSPLYDPTPVIKPRATSPAASPRHSPLPVDDRMSREPARRMPTRKSVSPQPPRFPADDGQRRLSGVPFNPDSFDVYNPTASRSPIPGNSDDERPGSSMEVNSKGQIVTFSGRVVDASDHLPIDNWAPEPEPKGTIKEKASRSRMQPNGGRDLDEAKRREEKYRRDRTERDRIRHAANVTFAPAEEAPSNALVTTKQIDWRDPNAGALVLAGASRARLENERRRGQQRGYDDPQDAHILRERNNPNSYATNPAYARHTAPPIPAKNGVVQNEDMALSLELQSIDIGPGSGARRPRGQSQAQAQAQDRGRRAYGF